jgi:bifunctional UDP-N-acetylglucosamine pyrophosphorylase/glucosamine-1-phosphate N-acetyltransferase
MSPDDDRFARHHVTPASSGAASHPAAERVGLIVLAAGAGTRMHSAVPKPLHLVAGVPMVERVLRAGEGAQPDDVVVVVGHDTSDLASRLEWSDRIATVVQDPPRGTGDAVRLALEALPALDRAVVLYCDHPLLLPETIARLRHTSRESGAWVTVLGAVLPDAAGFGRIVRDAEGRPIGIIERKDDDLARRQGPTEINSGMMALDAHWAREALSRLHPSGASGELYLTELVALAAREAEPDGSWPVATVRGDEDDALGVNDRVDLARAESRIWERTQERLMRSGVTLRLPETIVVDETVVVGPDTVILPGSALHGATEIGSGCVIGPAAIIHDSRLGDRVVVRSSTIEDSTIGDGVDIGPYAHLRSGTEIGPRSHIGNFAELKNARLAEGVKVGHFSYLGDASVGADANVGAGAITANFDGARKHRTEIGARAFIGSDTILRAPVRVGDDARTGAGSVVTRDVPDGATVVGIPARQARARPAIGTDRSGEG